MSKKVRLFESRVSYPDYALSPDAEEMCKAMTAYLKKELRIADFGIEYQLFTEDAFSGKPYKIPRPGVVVGEGAKLYSRSFDEAKGSAKDFATGWLSAKQSIGSSTQAYLPR